jgi:hypothetical protein
MKKILKHLRKRWLGYGLETLVVVNGVLIALGLNNWNEDRKLKIETNEFVERLINDIQTDTMAINFAMTVRNNAIAEIDTYFEFFDAGKSTLEAYVDSSSHVNNQLYRYFPVNFTFEEMKSSGNLNLLTSDQQQCLRHLASLQRTAQLIDDKLMEAYYQDANEERKYFPRRYQTATTDFYDILGMKQSPATLTQGLLHRHNRFASLRIYHAVAKNNGIGIIEKSIEALNILEQSPKTDKMD